MSHNKLRIDKNCLNCGHTVDERYCPQCGQENIELHDSAWHLLIHYAQDLFHYDGKTWHTLRNLVRKPGLVAADYLDGKRVMNIQPIRLYFFTSTVFFLVLFYIVKPGTEQGIHNPMVEYKKRMYFLKKEKELRSGSADTVEINKLILTLQYAMDSIQMAKGDSIDSNLELSLGPPELNSSTNLDSLGWLERIFVKRTEERRKEVEERNQGDEGAGVRDILLEMFHKLPQLIFLSLPFFALYLKILYFRSQRRLYVDHLIFSIYQYSYLYSILAMMLLLSYIPDMIKSESIGNLIGYGQQFIVLYLLVYLMLAMKRFYAGRWRFLLPKYLILMVFMLITILLLGTFVALVTYLL